MSNPTSENPNLADSLLFEQFATLATAPDGIGRLRALILQLAVQGRLGTQNAGDEPASVLLERIRKEKERLVKEGKIRTEKLLEPVNNREIPFEIPDGWMWVRLGPSLLKLQDGVHKSPLNLPNGDFKYVTAKNIKTSGIELSNITYISAKDHDDCYKRCNPEYGDILLIKDGATTGIATINNLNEQFSMLSSVALLKPPREIFNKYLLYVLRSPFFYSFLRGDMTGMAITRVTLVKLNRTIFPLPPLAEQHRIVAKVDRLMALCDELEARQQQERAGCLKLGTASFAGLQNAESPEEFGRQWAQVCDAFDLILDCPENIEKFRDTIVVLACSGKLSESWRTENQDMEPASSSLDKLIKDRKKKKFLKNNLKQHDFSDFSPIPDTWMWSTIEEVSERVTVGHVGSMMNEYKSTGIPFLRSQNVRKNNFDGKGLVYISQDFHDSLSKSKLEPGDLVVVRSGNVGVCCIIPDSLKEANCSDLVIVKQPFGFLPQYGAYYVNSISQTWINAGKVGMALTHFNTKSVANLPIPLPPLAEQHRIVAKVDALMALCDQLEAQLKERAGMQGKFADAVVKSIGTG
jgi:type I restriction enzyme S subunit